MWIVQEPEFNVISASANVLWRVELPAHDRELNEVFQMKQILTVNTQISYAVSDAVSDAVFTSPAVVTVATGLTPTVAGSSASPWPNSTLPRQPTFCVDWLEVLVIDVAICRRSPQPTSTLSHQPTLCWPSGSSRRRRRASAVKSRSLLATVACCSHCCHNCLGAICVSSHPCDCVDQSP